MTLVYQKQIQDAALKRVLEEERIESPIGLSQLKVNGNQSTVFGVKAVVSSNVLKSWKNGDDKIQFMVSDLEGVTMTLNLEAAARRVIPEDKPEGVVVLIINPDLRLDNSGKSTMSVKSQKQLLVLGRVKDYGHCGALKKDGISFCKMPVDKSLNEHCIYHNQNKKKSIPSTSLSRLVTTVTPSAPVNRPVQVSTHSYSNASNQTALSRASLSSPPSTTPSVATSMTSTTSTAAGYKTVNVSMADKSHSDNRGAMSSGATKVVAMEVMPLDKASTINITSSNSNNSSILGVKRPLASTDSSTAGVGSKRAAVPVGAMLRGDDLLTKALNKTLPTRLLQRPSITTTSKACGERLSSNSTSGIAAAHQRELSQGKSSCGVDHGLVMNGENGSGVEVNIGGADYDDSMFALRRDKGRVSQLLGGGSSSSSNNSYSCGDMSGSRPDALELSVIRNIIAKEKEAQSAPPLSAVRSTSDVRGVHVPAQSTSVFAFGAETHRQELIQKENMRQNKLSSIHNSSGGSGGGGSSGGSGVLPTRQVTTLGRIGQNNSSGQQSAALVNSQQQQMRPSTATHVGSAIVHSGMSIAGVNKVMRPTTAPSALSYQLPSSHSNNNTNAVATAGLKMVGRTLVNTANLNANAPNAVPAARSTSGINNSNSNGLTKSTATAALTMTNSMAANKGNLVSNILAQNNNKSISNNPANNRQPGNASTGLQTTSINSQGMRAATAVQKTAQKLALDNTIDALLNRKSINADSANDEWFEGYSARMNKLAQREYAQEKASSVHAINVKAFHCVTCNLVTEVSNPLCRQNKHIVSQVSTVKHFFECGACGKRDFTLGKGSVKVSLPPEARCTVCGNYQWRPCGMRGSGPLSVTSKDRQSSSVSDLTGGKLVLSASEWTTRRDVVHMAERTSTL